MMTEAQARTKECRVGGQTIVAPKVHRFPMCIASNCMHWLEMRSALPPYFSPVNGNLIAQGQPAHGDCGLKGRA
jgi:hypothetical protein